MAQAFGMGNAGSSGTSSAGNSFISTLVARMPYTYKILDNALERNPKYDIFNNLITKPEERMSRQSIYGAQTDGGAGMITIDKRYHQLMYADIDTDKTRRIQEYRKMAAYSELAECIDEIADEAIVKDTEGNIVKCFVKGDHEEITIEEIQKEWSKFIAIYDLENHGWEIIRKFLVEGELFYENVISQDRPDYGIIGVVSIPSELINPIYDNIQNQILKGFLLRKPMVDPKKTVTGQNQEELIVFDKNQVTYMNSGMWNEDCTIRLPYLENSRRAYKQLTLIEDSIIIYRLVRAPERLVFKIDVGSMPVPKAEEYMRKLMQQFWSKKNFDSSTNRVSNVYDPQSMLDAYWFSKRGKSDGTDVSTLPGGANLGTLDDLMYFMKKLYKSLKVPQQRLDPADAFQDGEQITREELRFSRFIIRIQQQIAIGLKNAFITHMKLREKRQHDKESRSLWEKFNLKEHQLRIEFNIPTSFAIMREQQIFDLKKNNFTGLVSTELMSQSFCQKYYLGLTIEQMKENAEWLRKDAGLSWEMQQIISNGPDFRKQLAAQAELEQIAGGAGAVAGAETALPLQGGQQPAGAGAEDQFKPQLPPDFGPAPTTPPSVNAVGAGKAAPPAA